MGKKEASLCGCGRGHIITLPNGERACTDTLRRFRIMYGRSYRFSQNVDVEKKEVI